LFYADYGIYAFFDHTGSRFTRLTDIFNTTQRSKKMANREFYDVIIIGGGPAGLSAGIYAIGDLREKYGRQIVLSAADGCTAVLAAAYYVEVKRAAENL
jgi:alkyl hydroperoxide reductase subunit AhpF